MDHKAPQYGSSASELKDSARVKTSSAMFNSSIFIFTYVCDVWYLRVERREHDKHLYKHLRNQGKNRFEIQGVHEVNSTLTTSTAFNMLMT